MRTFRAGLAIVLGCLSVVCLTVRAQAPDSAPPTAPALHPRQMAPREYVVAFLPLKMGEEGLAFLAAPDGTAVIIPIKEVGDALRAGYRPVTVGDLTDGAALYIKTIQDQQKKLDDFAADYNSLVQRFNRLAAVNSTAPATNYSASSPADERSGMRLMLFQSVLSRMSTPAPKRIEVVDCNKSPALCVH